MSKIADETLFKLIHDFLLIYLPTQRNSSPNTIRAYKTSLEMLLDFIKEYNQTSLSKVTFRMLDRKAVSAFLTYLEAEKGAAFRPGTTGLSVSRRFSNMLLWLSLPLLYIRQNYQKSR